MVKFHFFACSCPDLPILFIEEAIFTPFYAPADNGHFTSCYNFSQYRKYLKQLDIMIQKSYCCWNNFTAVKVSHINSSPCNFRLSSLRSIIECSVKANFQTILCSTVVEGSSQWKHPSYNIIHFREKVEAPQLSICGWMKKQHVAHSYNII